MDTRIQTASIGAARSFSLEQVTRNELFRSDDLVSFLLCFEAGQSSAETTHHGSSIYHVVEGEALLRSDEERQRLGKGKLALVPAGVTHTLENAGGGLLVVLASRTA